MADTELRNLRTKISMDTVSFEDSAQTVQRELKKLRSELKLVNADTNLYSRDSESLSNKMKVLTKQQDALKISISQSHSEYEKYREEVRKGGDQLEHNTKKMAFYANEEAKARAELSRTRAEMSLLTTEMLRQESALYQLGTGLQTAGDKLKGWGTSLDAAANVWLKVSGAVAASGALLVGAAIEWESSVASMAKTIDASPAQFAEMTDGIRELALEIPTTAAELAELASIAGQLGIDNENVVAFVEVVSKLGTATNMTSDVVASQFAKFANITSMSEGDFERLGSVIVDLGNNFATVESDITDMAMRVAGAGETVGLTEAEIMGLSATLSSLGIEAEMGGSAISKLLVSMELAAQTGLDPMVRLSEQSGMTRRELELMASNAGKDFKGLADSLGMTTTEMTDIMTASRNLENFASIAGVSVEDFTAKFNDPNGGAIAAMQMFIGGLKETGTESESTIEKLDGMGISEIRMRDALLRLANGSGVLTDAITTANTAWDENTALQTEAEKRYATTESQLLLLKNKLMEVAISAGEELLPALNNIVDSLDPMIKSLSDGVKWFAGLDKATKESTLKIAGFVVAGGPMLKVLATTVKSLSGVTSGFGSFLNLIVDTRIKGEKLTKANAVLSDGLGTLGKASRKSADDQIGLTLAIKKGYSVVTDSFKKFAAENTSLVGSITGTTKSMGYFVTGLLSTPAGALVAIAAIGAMGIALVDMKLKYDDNKRQHEIWGDGLDEKTMDTLDSFKTFSLEVNNELDNFNRGLSESADDAISAYDAMIADLQRQGTQAKEAIVESFDNLPETLKAKLQETLNERVTHIDDLIAEATTAEAQITEILKTAETERRVLTETEQARIQALQAQIASVQAELAAENAEQQKKILGNLTTEIDNLNRVQLNSHYDMLTEKRTLEKENYEESLADLEKWKGELTDTQYMQYLDEINRKYDKSNQDLLVSQVATLAEMGAADASIEALLEGSGMTYAEAMARYAEITGQSTKGIIENTGEVSKAVDEANKTWNGMILDPISGVVNTNVGEVAKVASESEKGWNDLQFAMKHAQLDTNTKEQIKQALIENGKWNELTFEEQQAFLGTNAKDAAQEFMEASGKWDNLNPNEVQMWMHTNSTEAKNEFMEANGIWNAITPEQKDLIMDTNSYDITQEFLEANGIWDSLSPEQQNLIMQTNSYATMEDFLKAYGMWDEMDPELKEYVTDTNAEVTQVKVDGAYRAFQAMNPGVKEFNVKTNALQIIAEVQQAINGLKDTDIYVDAATQRVYTTASATGQQQAYAQGTNYHMGGYAILGDGGKREPFLTPQGFFGLSPSTDTLYNLPKGSKVWSSIQKFKDSARNNDFLNALADKLPMFAEGTRRSFMDDVRMPDLFNGGSAPAQPIVNVYQTINSPDPIDAREAARLSKINLQNLGYLLSRG